MSETTQKIREEFGHYAERTGDGELLMLVNDADRLAAIEPELRDAIESLDAASMTEYHRGDAVRQAEYKAIADKLRAILDPPEGS